MNIIKSALAICVQSPLTVDFRIRSHNRRPLLIGSAGRVETAVKVATLSAAVEATLSVLLHDLRVLHWNE